MRHWLLILSLASCERWTKRDTALELAFVGVTAVDWRQTIDITKDCDESNPMIGPCGRVVPPNIYFPMAILVHAAVAACLPPTWRTVFQAFTTGLEVATIAQNHRDGYDML
jgi:hypothetical protein